jgi:hypothetical protein
MLVGLNKIILRLEGHVACMGDTRFWLHNIKGREYLEDVSENWAFVTTAVNLWV